jgi:hypothetical protein
MAKKQVNTDVFLQFAVLEGVWPGVSTDLSEVTMKTGLSIRGGLAWLIHLIEVWVNQQNTTNIAVEVALSTIAGLTAMPTPGDKGTVGFFSTHRHLATQGASLKVSPTRHSFLPPVCLASPDLSLYWQASADDATLDGGDVFCRIGFTTTPMEKDLYAEIAETWQHV